MIKTNRIVMTLLLAGAATALGCELIANVDRSLIEGGGGSSSNTGTGGVASTTTAASTGGAGGMATATSTATSSASGTGGAGGTGGGTASSSASGTGGDTSTASSSSSVASSSSSVASSSVASSSSGIICAQPCATAADCPATGNECTGNVCDAMGCCATANLDQTHTLSTGQSAGDCQKIVCNGAGSTTSVDDATDLPSGTEVCLTNPACTGSPLAPSFTPAAKDTDCTADNKAPKHLCGDPTVPVLAGTCVECNAASDCAAASCSGTTFTSAATCNASGACVAGIVTSCGAMSKVCNALLGCVQCNTVADCPATGNECVVATCNGTCGTTNLGSTHVLSTGQTPGDCQKIVCNGAGGLTSVDDATDLPTSSTVCQVNPACQGPSPLTPSFTSVAADTDCTADNQSPQHVCGSGVFAGVCVQCNSDSDCLAVSDAGTLTCSAAHVCQ